MCLATALPDLVTHPDTSDVLPRNKQEDKVINNIINVIEVNFVVLFLISTVVFFFIDSNMKSVLVVAPVCKCIRLMDAFEIQGNVFIVGMRVEGNSDQSERKVFALVLVVSQKRKYVLYCFYFS